MSNSYNTDDMFLSNVMQGLIWVVAFIIFAIVWSEDETRLERKVESLSQSVMIKERIIKHKHDKIAALELSVANAQAEAKALAAEELAAAKSIIKVNEIKMKTGADIGRQLIRLFDEKSSADEAQKYSYDMKGNLIKVD